MALPDYFKVEPGTAIIWGEAGAAGVTHTLSLDALANAAARMGAEADLGANWDEEYAVTLIVETGTAPVAGVIAELFLAWSRDGTEYPGKVTGADAAYPATVAANKLQLGLPAVTLIATADANTILQQNWEIVRPPCRWVAPVVVNLLGQAFRDEATATNNDSRVIMIPRRFLIQDAA